MIPQAISFNLISFTPERAYSFSLSGLFQPFYLAGVIL